MQGITRGRRVSALRSGCCRDSRWARPVGVRGHLRTGLFRVGADHIRTGTASTPSTYRCGSSWECITFELQHTGGSDDISVGCHIPWAIQKFEDGTWKHTVWTDQRWHLLCATLISPGETLTITVPLSPAALADEYGVSEEEAEVTFTPGKYRFVVFVNPPLAVNFRVLSTE